MEASADVVSPSPALVVPFAPAWRGERSTALLSEKPSAALRIATAHDAHLVAVDTLHLVLPLSSNTGGPLGGGPSSTGRNSTAGIRHMEYGVLSTDEHIAC